MSMIFRLLPLAILTVGTQLFACVGTLDGVDSLEDDTDGAGAGSSGGAGTSTTGGAPPSANSNGTSGGTPASNSTGASSGSGGGTGDGSTGDGSTGGATAGNTGGFDGGAGPGPALPDAGEPEQDAGSADVDAGPPVDPVDPIEESIMRGAGIYPAMCASCHGADGSGGRSRKPLTGFTSVAELSAIIDRAMPPGNPNACSATCAEDVARYIVETF